MSGGRLSGQFSIFLIQKPWNPLRRFESPPDDHERPDDISNHVVQEPVRGDGNGDVLKRAAAVHFNAALDHVANRTLANRAGGLEAGKILFAYKKRRRLVHRGSV